MITLEQPDAGAEASLMEHMATVSDLELVAAAAKSDVGAFLELQRRYDAIILDAARRADAGDDVEDVRQEMWLLLLRGRWSIPNGYEGDLSRLVRVITRNTVYQLRLRSGGITRTEEGATLRRYFEPPASTEGWSEADERASRVPAALVTTFDPVDEIHTRQLFALLTLAWATLPAFTRMVMRMRYCEPAHTIPEIVTQTQRSQTYIARTIRYARQHLCRACGVPYLETRTFARASDDRAPFHDGQQRRDPALSARRIRYRRQLAAARAKRQHTQGAEAVA